MTPEEEVARAERAALLLNEPLLAEAFDTLHTEYTNAWLASPARDTQGRETLWLTLKLLERVKQHLHTTVQTGQLASESLRQLGVEPSTDWSVVQFASSRR